MSTPVPPLVPTASMPLATDSDAQFDAKAFPSLASLNPFGVSLEAIAASAVSNADAALAAAIGGDLPPLTGKALQYLRVNAGETAAEFHDVLGDVSQVIAGTVIWYAASSAPAGYLKANGAAISRTTYSSLFSAIGTTFGVGDGSTTFNLPDLRGEFIRGWDDVRGVDSGRVFGSAQADEFKSHNHSVSYSFASGSSLRADGGGGFAYSGSTGSRGGTETRPRNVALLACIKF